MSKPNTKLVPALWRRALAMIYDALLVIAVVFLASAWMPLIPQHWQFSTAAQVFKFSYVLFIVFCFFAWFWTHGGQTLGMRAWKFRLRTMDGFESLTLRHAVIRYLGAWLSAIAFGLGFVWALFDRHGLTWHDHWSRSFPERYEESPSIADKHNHS